MFKQTQPLQEVKHCKLAVGWWTCAGWELAEIKISMWPLKKWKVQPKRCPPPPRIFGASQHGGPPSPKQEAKHFGETVIEQRPKPVDFGFCQDGKGWWLLKKLPFLEAPKKNTPCYNAGIHFSTDPAGPRAAGWKRSHLRVAFPRKKKASLLKLARGNEGQENRRLCFLFPGARSLAEGRPAIRLPACHVSSPLKGIVLSWLAAWAIAQDEPR